MLQNLKLDAFSLEAYAVYQGILKNQEELINRGILNKPKFNIDEEYVLDITRMMKVVYSKNLKNFITHTSGIELRDALSAITDKLFLSKTMSEKNDKRRDYKLPEYSLFTITQKDKRVYLNPEESKDIFEAIPGMVYANINHKENKYNFLDSETNCNPTVYIEKTRLTKPQLIIMGYKKDIDKIESLKDARLKETNGLKKTQEKRLYNQTAEVLHKKAVYNYLAMIIQNGMVDFIKDTCKEMYQEMSGVIANSQDDDEVRDYDRYFMVEDDSQDLLKEVELIQDTKKLAKRAYELQLEEGCKTSYKVEAIEVVLQISMYSFKPMEIAQILNTPYEVISNIRELLKESLFVSAMEQNLGAITDLETIDKYLEGMSDSLEDYRETEPKANSLSIVEIQRQLKQTMGRDYYMIQEVREYLDSKI